MQREICYNIYEDVIMYAALHVTTKVQAGRKVEIPTPELAEGETVEVFVVASKPATTAPRISMRDYLKKPSIGPRSASSWEEFERQFQEERNAWDR